MSNNINLSIIGNDNKKNEEITIENPQTLDGLLLSINKFFKNLPEYFTIFYKSEDKEVNIKKGEDFKLSNGILYIRPKNDKDIEDTIFQKDKIDEKNKIDEPGKEKKKNEIGENTNFVEKTLNLVKDVWNKIKKIELPISLPFLAANNDNLPYSCIPRIDSQYPDLSYDNMDKE
jgi:hypothetical protein